MDSAVYWEVNVTICRFDGRKPQKKIRFLILNVPVQNSISSKHFIFLAKIYPISLELEHSYPIKPSTDWATALSFSLQIDTLIFLMPDRTASWEIEPNFHSIPSKTPLLRIFVNVICARPNTRYKLFGSWLFGYAYRGSLYCVGCCR